MGRLTGLLTGLLCLVVGASSSAQSGAAAPGAPPAGGQGPARASFSYREDPSQLVLRYVERPGELGGSDVEHTVSVYGDGRVVTRRPRFAKRAGSWGTNLSRGEMQEFLRTVLGRGVVELDETRLRRSRRELKERRRLERGELYHVSDAETVTLELHLERYRGAKAGAREQRDVVKRVRWRGLRSDLRRYPELEELRGLADVHGDVRALMERPDLRRLDSPGRP